MGSILFRHGEYSIVKIFMSRVDRKKSLRHTPPYSEGIHMTNETYPEPCPDCKYWDKCRDEELTCGAFRMWVRDGYYKEGMIRAPNRPWRLSFGDDDD